MLFSCEKRGADRTLTHHQDGGGRIVAARIWSMDNQNRSVMPHAGVEGERKWMREVRVRGKCQVKSLASTCGGFAESYHGRGAGR